MYRVCVHFLMMFIDFVGEVKFEAHVPNVAFIDCVLY